MQKRRETTTGGMIRNTRAMSKPMLAVMAATLLGLGGCTTVSDTYNAAKERVFGSDKDKKADKERAMDKKEHAMDKKDKHVKDAMHKKKHAMDEYGKHKDGMDKKKKRAMDEYGKHKDGMDKRSKKEMRKMKDAMQGAKNMGPMRRYADNSIRIDDDKARDKYRHPNQTLHFLGLKPGMKVIEIWPGAGYYTSILAPYAHRHDGEYTAVLYDPAMGEFAKRAERSFQREFVEKPEVYGKINVAVMGTEKSTMGENGPADMILTFRNVHNWMEGGYADSVFADFYSTLRPGGHLGVVEHRADADAAYDPLAKSGYVSEEKVMELAKAAGFVLVRSTEINANPKDMKNYPKGVWTLPPTLAEGDKDEAKYMAIGESDRMTLLFMKPKA